MRKQLLTTALSVCAIMATAQNLPYQNANLSAAQRADNLLSRLTLEEKVSLMMDTSPAIERLGIPQFQWWNEALHGIGRNGFATVFPITMGMAASSFWTPNINIFRDPRWGRGQETYGEDPYLTTKMGLAVVRGL